MLATTSIQKMALRTTPFMLSRALTTSNLCRLTALCRANSAVLSQNITVIDNLINKKKVEGANQVFRTECLGTTVGKQFRHSLDHLERVALDGLRTVRDDDKPIDLHYDVRERGTLCETDVCEARDRALFIQDVFDGVCATAEKEGHEQCSMDGARRLTAYFTIPGAADEEIGLSSTLEREMGFVCHHAIHHQALVKFIAALDTTGLTLEDLPPDFGQAPTTMVQDARPPAAA